MSSGHAHLALAARDLAPRFRVVQAAEESVSKLGAGAVGVPAKPCPRESCLPIPMQLARYPVVRNARRGGDKQGLGGPQKNRD